MYPPMGPIKFQRNYSFAEAAATASDNDMLDDNLTNHLNVHFGLICFNFAFMPLRFDGTFGEYLSRSTLKRNLLKEYIGKKLWRTDTLVHHCKTNLSWFWWSHFLRLPTDALSLTDRWAKDVGLINGVTIPLSRLGFYRSGISLVGAADDDGNDLERRVHAQREELTELVHLYQAYLDTPNLAIDHYRLSPQHQEILRITAHEQSIKMTAQHLGLSKARVRKLRGQVMKRFKADNMTGVVNKATALGVLSL